MAITTLDGVIAGMQPPVPFAKALTPTLVAGRPHSLFYVAGFPGAATAPSPGMGGAALTSYAGQLPFSNPASGNSYLARLQGQTSTGGTLILADRLWHNSGLSMTSTAAQTINSVAFPARDADGSTDGNRVQIALEAADATVQDGWKYATEFRRTDPFVIGMGQALGKTDEEMDDLFRLAATL